MNIIPITLIKCKLNLGQIHQELDFGYFHPEFLCRTIEGDEFIAKMRLHITESFEPLIIADPRFFRDEGYSVNSVGSPILNRKHSYECDQDAMLVQKDLIQNIPFYAINSQQIKECLLEDYVYEDELERLHQNAKKPTIAFTLHDPGVVGGGNSMIFRVIGWLLELGFEVTAYTCSGRYPYWSKLNVSIRQFPTYEEMCEAIDQDIVILFSMWHIEPIMLTRPKGKLVLHYRQTLEARNYGFDIQSINAEKPVIDLLESLPIGYFIVSPHLQEAYSNLIGKPGLEITNGIDLSMFTPGNKIASDVVRILSVGNPFHENKNTATLSGAMKLVARKRPAKKIEWYIAGGDVGQEEPYALFDPKISVHLTKNLNPSEMRAFYQGGTIFVNPSRYEGFGLPTLEAMACGVPVITADNQGLNGIVEDGKNCFIVPAEGEEAMANAILSLVDSPSLADQLVCSGFETVQNYSVAHQYKQFKEAFNTLVGVSFPMTIAEERENNLLNQQRKTTVQKQQPLVSVVIPSYNQAEYLKQALDSLVAQTYPYWEAIVVNDGSTDHTKDVITEYEEKDERICGFHKTNGGITSALNEGLKQARGDYFCWLSSDDLFYPQKLESQIQAFCNLTEEYALVYGSFDQLNEVSGKLEVQGFMPPITAGAEFPEAFKFDFIDGCTIMIRMNVMREVNGFNPYYRHAQDTELWMRIASRGYRFHILPEKFTIRRIHPAQSSTANMIHCRYDAACMVNYYLDHYHLLEVYRYFDLSDKKRLREFVEHLAGRTFHTEAAVNHPVLYEKYWSWIRTGLEVLHVDQQVEILSLLHDAWANNLHLTKKNQYYLDKCKEALALPRQQVEKIISYGAEGRDIRNNNRYHEPIDHALFDYGCDLLINNTTPLFAQELLFHDTNKVVDGPYKLAHSAFRYLSQFPNYYQKVVQPYASLEYIPSSPADAVILLCNLRYPLLADQFQISAKYHVNRIGTLEESLAADQKISKMPKLYRNDLLRMIEKEPSELLLYYWLQLTIDPKTTYQSVLKRASMKAKLSKSLSRPQDLGGNAILSKLRNKLDKSKKYFKYPRLILPKAIDILIHKLLWLRQRIH